MMKAISTESLKIMLKEYERKGFHYLPDDQSAFVFAILDELEIRGVDVNAA